MLRGGGAYLRTVLFQVNMVGMAKFSQRRHYITKYIFRISVIKGKPGSRKPTFSTSALNLNIVCYWVFSFFFFFRLVHTGQYVMNSF